MHFCPAIAIGREQADAEVRKTVSYHTSFAFQLSASGTKPLVMQHFFDPRIAFRFDDPKGLLSLNPPHLHVGGGVQWLMVEAKVEPCSASSAAGRCFVSTLDPPQIWSHGRAGSLWFESHLPLWALEREMQYDGMSNLPEQGGGEAR